MYAVGAPAIGKLVVVVVYRAFKFERTKSVDAGECNRPLKFNCSYKQDEYRLTIRLVSLSRTVYVTDG